MRRVIDYAKQKGLRRVSGDVLAENTTMLQMCAELGFHAEAIGSDIKRVVLDLENIGVQCTQPLGAVRKPWPYTRSCPGCLTKNEISGVRNRILTIGFTLENHLREKDEHFPAESSIS